MDNKVLIPLIEKRVNQTITYANLPGLSIEAFSWEDYTLSIQSSNKSHMVSVYLFKDAEELAHTDFVRLNESVLKFLFESMVVPNVPEYIDHVEINDCADNGYIGDNTWAVRVQEESPIEQHDVFTSSLYISDTMDELDNQDLADFMGFSQFDQEISDADYEDTMTAWAEIDLQIALEQAGV